MPTQLAAVVMAGGLGTRMHSAIPKHLHPLLGRRMVDWVIRAVQSLDPVRLVVVTSPGTEREYEGVEVAVQPVARGTGDAAAVARSVLAGFDGDVLVAAGDSPLLTRDVLAGLLHTHAREEPAVTVLSFEPDTPLPYGRILRGSDGSVRSIVEEKDATDEEREITELSGSLYVFRPPALWDALEALDAENAQGELYLTDTVAHIVASGGRAVAFCCGDRVAPIGVNTRAELAFAADVLRRRVNEEHMLAGVTLVDPMSTWIDVGVTLEPDVVVHPFSVLRGATRAGAGAEIGPHAVAHDADIGPGALVGPFCYLRPGTVLEAKAKAGTFVEVKNARIGERAKVPHLSYIGDAEIGAGTNIGAGNITANFSHRPGVPKGRTRIGRNVRTGVDNTFKAPVTIGDDAWIFPGTVITDDVPPGTLAGFPPRQVNKEGYVYRQPDND
jgi:bifunctional UDP-N-acetylglucosamine pyrophosphorylase / glucosamine-1-phosphate N-acetyltransferase